MKIMCELGRFVTRKGVAWTGGALLAGVATFGLVAGAENPTPEERDHARPEHSSACEKGPHGERGPGHHNGFGPQGRDVHRSPHQRGGSYGHPDGPPPRHDGFRPSYGPPQHRESYGPSREGYGRPDAPPPSRDGRGPSREGYGRSYGPPPHHEGHGPSRDVFRRPDGPPPHRGAFEGYGSRGSFGPPPPEGRGSDENHVHYARRPDGEPRFPSPPRAFQSDRRGGPDQGGFRPRRPAPPAFEEFDENGDGTITAEEFKAFHERRRGPHAPQPNSAEPKDTLPDSTESSPTE